MIKMQKVKFYLFFGDSKKAKQQLLDILDKNSNSYKVTEAYEDRRYYTEQIEYLYKIIDNTKKTK